MPQLDCLVPRGRLPRQAVVLSALAEAQVNPGGHLCSLVEGVDLIWVEFV